MVIANQIISFKLSGINFSGTATQLNYTAGVTPGTAVTSKALVVDSARSIGNLATVTATNISATSLNGLISTPSQPNITSLGTLNNLTVSGNLSLSGHNGSTTGLSLGGVLVTATATELNYNRATPGTASASRALILDTSRSISNIATMGVDTISTTNISLAGTMVTATAAQINRLSVTPGTASANAVVVVDSDRNVTNINALTVGSLSATSLSGVIQTQSQPNITSVGSLSSLSVAGALSVTGACTMGSTLAVTGNISAPAISGTVQTALQPNITSIGTLTGLTVSGNTTLNTLSVSGVTIAGGILSSSAADLNKLQSVTDGTAQSSRALVVDSQRNIANINTLTAGTVIATNVQGTLQTAAQPNVTSLGTLSGLTVGGASSVSITNTTSVFQTALSISNASTGVQLATGLSSSSARIGTSGSHDLHIVTSNSDRIVISSTGNIGVGAQPGTDRITVAGTVGVTGLSIGGTNVTASATELNRISGVIPGTAQAARCVVLDNTSSVSGLGSVSAASLTANTLTGTLQTPAQNNITSVGPLNSLLLTPTNSIVNTTPNASSVTGLLYRSTTSRFFGCRQINDNAVSILSYAAGGVYNDYMTWDHNNGFPNMVINATRVGIGKTSPAHALDILGDASIDGLLIGGTRVNTSAAELNALSSVSPGTASASSAVVLDSNRSVVNINSITAATLVGTLSTPLQPNITSVGTLTSLTISGNIQSTGSINLSGDITGAASVSAQSLQGTLLTSNQPNITGLGSLGSLSVVNAIKVGTVASTPDDMIHLEGNNENGMGIQIENRNTTSNSGSYIRFCGYSDGNSNYDLASIFCGYVPASSIFGHGYLTFNTRNNQLAGRAAERMRILADGRVGINTSTPSTQLDVSGSFNATTISIAGTQVTSTASEINALGGVIAGTASANRALVVNSSRSIFNIEQLSAVTLGGTLSTAAQPNITSLGTLTGLSVSGTVGANALASSSLNSATITSTNISAVNISGTITTASQPNITTVGLLGSTRAATLKLGTAPTFAEDFLHLEFTDPFTRGITIENRSSSSGSGGHLTFQGVSNTTGAYNVGRVSCLYTPINASSGSGALAFSTRDSTDTFAERMRISDNGSVGINTVTPNYTLDVNGTARATACMLGVSTDTSRILSALSGNTTANGQTWFTFGVANSSRNQAEFSFYYAASGSTNNLLRFGLHGSNNRVHLNSNGWMGLNMPWTSTTPSQPSNNLTINQGGTSSCVDLDFNTGVSSSRCRMGVTSGGKLYVNAGASFGTTTDTGFGYVYINGSDTVTYTNYAFLTGSGNVGTNGTSGSIPVSLRTSNRIVSGQELGVLSDRRLKENIHSLPDKVVDSFFDNVNSVEYNYRNSKKKSYGFVAQDFIKSTDLQNMIDIVPNNNVSEVDKEYNIPAGQSLVLSKEEIIPILTEAVRNLRNDNADLKKRVSDLESLVQSLLDKISG